MISKLELRKKAKEIRKSLDMKSISDKIVENIRNLEIYQKAKNIMLFYPLDNEVNLLALLEDNKNFYLPKVEDQELLVCPYKKGDTLFVSNFKTKEPLSSPVATDLLDVVFVPALMVGKDFYRLGYGKGFYDRFLIKNAIQAIRIVPIPSELLAETIPSDPFDVQVDAIIDEL